MGEDASRSRSPHRLTHLARPRSALLALLARRCLDPPLPQIIEALNRLPIRGLNLFSS